MFIFGSGPVVNYESEMDDGGLLGDMSWLYFEESLCWCGCVLVMDSLIVRLTFNLDCAVLDECPDFSDAAFQAIALLDTGHIQGSLGNSTMRDSDMNCLLGPRLI